MVTLTAGFEAKDWVSNSIAALALIATIALGLWTNRRNRAAQGRQEQMVRAQHDTNTRLAEILESLADRAGTGDAGTVAAASSVEWTLEHASKRRWLLRNLGPATARGVVIDRDALGGARVDLHPEPPADLGPGESLSISAVEAWGAPLTDEVGVRWNDTETATLPLPRWL